MEENKEKKKKIPDQRSEEKERIIRKGEFGQARWRLVYAPQIPSLVSVDPTADPLKSLASNISFGTEVEVQLGKRLQVIIIKLINLSNLCFA